MIQANIIIIFLCIGAFIRLSFALNSSGTFGSSHLSLTNQPNGIRFKVYSVHDLSVHNLHAFGGIPIPNSKTFTQLFLAAIKCHNSCIITSNIKTNNPDNTISAITKMLFKTPISYL
ncbi:MAG: hypothetical protein WCG25_08320 [bacterium]